MNSGKPILYSVVTPFNPKWSFRHFELNSHKKKTAILSLLFGILAILSVYIIGLSRVTQYEPIKLIFNVLGFTAGLTLKNLLIAYLVLIFVNRIGLGQLNWEESLGIVSFALFPLMIGLIWALIDIRTSEIGQAIGTIWNAVIILIGLKVLKDVTLWKGALLVTGILAATKIIESTLVGLRI